MQALLFKSLVAFLCALVLGVTWSREGEAGPREYRESDEAAQALVGHLRTKGMSEWLRAERDAYKSRVLAGGNVGMLLNLLGEKIENRFQKWFPGAFEIESVYPSKVRATVVLKGKPYLVHIDADGVEVCQKGDSTDGM